ncbi:hypothetical protein [Cupriavidus taiwanensis]|uniref:hypothetical protein n=1 Tax=Cupriavidus taiwanensis TaxID=164546 RepID=UPI000E1884D9|nr:hypothetical protein [Cupriavidus taiwanensis]SPC08019.1 hypothetical protein CT19431_180009 [Cupriavidus taiwanensis]
MIRKKSRAIARLFCFLRNIGGPAIGFDLLPVGTKPAAVRSSSFDTQFAEGPCHEGSRRSGGNS